MLIYKTELPVDTLDFRKIKLPAKTVEEAVSLVMSIGLQYDMPKMWYQADTGEEEKEFTILAIGTGHQWDNLITKANYIGTLPLGDGELVLHYFIIEGDFLDKTKKVCRV